MSDPLDALLAQLPDGPMKLALRAQEPAFAEELLLSYLSSDATAQRDIEAFFTSDGPEKVEACRQEIVREDDGTPTAEDLGRWLS